MVKSEALEAIERREGQLWLLACLLLVLLAVSLFMVDITLPTLRGASLMRSLGELLGSATARAVLLVIVLLICVYFREKVQALRLANRELVESLARNQSSLESKSRQLDRWHELSHDLITTRDFPRLLELVVETALEVTAAESGSLMLLDPAGEYLEVKAALGGAAEARRNARVRMGEGIAGYVARLGCPVLLREGELSRDLEPLLVRRHEIGSAICMPLALGEKTVGVLTVNRRPSTADFGHQDLQILSAFAGQAVLAIDKAQLYVSYQEQVARLEEMLRELERTQEQLLRSEKLASIGLLAGGLAHEINNPLTVILGRTEMLLAAVPEGRRRRELEIIHEQSRRIADLVRSLLACSRGHAQREMAPLAVETLLADVLAAVAEGRPAGVAVEAEIAPDLPPVQANRRLLEQVFGNIIRNAYQAMPQGGRLHVRAAAHDDRVAVALADSGPGIAPDDLPLIFDPFFTTRRESGGTGLGLAVANGIVASHGGEIKVQSTPGQGTVFTVELPALKKEPDASDHIGG